MPVKPWTVGPKRSLGIFEGLEEVLDKRDSRKAAATAQQITLEDRLAAKAQREAANKSRTIEDALHQAQLDATRAKPSVTIIGQKTDEGTGEVYNLYSDGSAKPVTVAGARPPMGPAPVGHENDAEEHDMGATQQQAAPSAPSPSTLKLTPKKKDAVLRSVGDDVYDFTDPKNPVLVKQAPPKKDTGVALTKQLQRETGLASQYQGNPTVKNAYGIANASEQIRAIGSQPANPQNDLDIIYQVVKLRDPNSVVREGEIDLQKAARSLGTYVTAAWKKAKSGQLLTAQEREQILALVNVKEDAARHQIEPIQKEYGRMARQFGADSAFVAPSPFTRAETPKANKGAAHPLIAKYGLTPPRGR